LQQARQGQPEKSNAARLHDLPPAQASQRPEFMAALRVWPGYIHDGSSTWQAEIGGTPAGKSIPVDAIAMIPVGSCRGKLCQHR
jgi:hypothetical protein